MVQHLVLFRPKANLSAADRGGLVASFARALREIPSIRTCRVGRRITHGRGYEQLMHENYEYVVMLEFDDVPALKAYLQHPAHEELAERFFGAFETALMYDYEMTEGAAGLADVF
jgi:hypothetical protein